MRALHFAKPLEYRLETPAEELVQGERVEGLLSVTNRGGAELNGESLDIALAYGTLKDIKAEGAAAFRQLERQRLGKNLSMAPGAKHEARWSLSLGHDCPITTKDGTLFLLYGGDLDQSQGWGRIDLQVALHPVLETLVATIENQFQFEAGLRKNLDQHVEVKFKPPSSYPTVRELFVRMALRDEVLDLVFRASIKSLARGGPKGIRTRWEEVARMTGRDVYMIGNTHPDRAAMKEMVGDMLGELLPTPAND